MMAQADAPGASLADLLVLAGHRAHLERERALGHIEALLDAAGGTASNAGEQSAAAAGACRRLPPPAATSPPPACCPRSLVSLPPDSLSKTTAQSGDAAPLAVVCDGARSLVAAAEWEQRLGGLRLARAVLQREAQPAFAADMIATCQRLLEDSEVRVRWAVSFK